MKRFSLLAVIASLIGGAVAAPGAVAADATGPCSVTTGRPWCDPSKTADERAGLLLGALTDDEKISLLAGDPNANGHTGATPAVARLGLPQSYNTDGPVGVRQGSATAMPTPMALAATFDPSLARLYGTVLGNEARAKGNDGLLGPTLNIMRTPLNGRTFEAFGEDPFLVARTGAEWIRGAQSQGVYATPKHYAANNMEGLDLTGVAGSPSAPIGVGQVNMRYLENSVVDDRTLREIYLPAFQAAVAAGAGSVMCSYNRVNGPWACASDTLLDQILKREWGFKGFVMSDWVFATHPWDTAHSLNAGMDVEMPFPDQNAPLLVKLALATGQAGMSEVDDHVRRLLRTLFTVGFFDRPTPTPDDGAIDQAAHADAAEQVAQNGITLLKNNAILPLNDRKVRSIAVIGAYADKFVTGGGSGNVTPFSTVTGLAGIRARVPGARVTYADGSDASAAAAAARSADVAIVFAGDYETEGTDRQCLTLECPNQGDQDGLIAQVAAAQPKTVVVLETGGPVLTPWQGKVKALLEAWYPGESGGTAIARVLFGDADPGGRLPATFPASADQEQVAGDSARYPGDATGDVHYSEGVLNGYRWFDAKHEQPAFPFGFGLSYTSFAYRNLRVTPGGAGGAVATVTADVTNVGRRTGIAAPQLYLGLPQPDAATVQPPRQLKGYTKLTLAPRAHARVSFPLDRHALSYWNTAASSWTVAPGCYRVYLGASSRNLPLRAALPVGGGTC
jgi:beta-glucosidase